MTTLKNYKYNKQMYLQIGGSDECKINNGHIFHNGDYCGNTLEKAPEKSTFYECGKKSEEKKEDGSEAYICWPTIMIIFSASNIDATIIINIIKNIPDFNNKYQYYVSCVFGEMRSKKIRKFNAQSNNLILFDGVELNDIKYDYIICRVKGISQTKYDEFIPKMKNKNITSYTFDIKTNKYTQNEITFSDSKTTSMFLLHCSNKSSKKLVVVSDDITDAKLVVLKSTSEVKKINEIDEKQQYDEITFNNINYILIANIKKLINMLTSSGKIIITVQNHNLEFDDKVYENLNLLLTTTNIDNNSANVIDESIKTNYSTIEGIIKQNEGQLQGFNIKYNILSPSIIINKQVLTP